MPSGRAAAFIFIFQRRLKSFFLSLRPRNACTPACKSAVRASRFFLLLPKRYPFTCFKIFLLRLSALIPFFTRVIYFFYITFEKSGHVFCSSSQKALSSFGLIVFRVLPLH